jgi:mRNA interferase MazF
MNSVAPSRGQIWLADLNPTRGHEQSGVRPCLVVSVDYFNSSPAGLVIVLPVATKDKGVRSHVAIAPPEAGLKELSFVKCEDLRSISTELLVSPWGIVKRETMEAVEDRLQILLGL